MSCSNNLKQIGLGMHNYHDSYNSFPPGGITEGNCCGSPSLTSWPISILPYVELETLYNRYNMNVFNENPANAFVREQFVPVYACPSEPNTKQLERPESGPGSNLSYMPGSYRGMGGKSNGCGWWDNNQNSCLPRHWRGPLHTVGVTGLRPESFATITDGTSNTLINDYDRCVAIGGPGGSNTCKRGWGSFHPGGLQFLLCDGSVRFLNQNINMNLWTDLATVAGGEAVQLP